MNTNPETRTGDQPRWQPPVNNIYFDIATRIADSVTELFLALRGTGHSLTVKTDNAFFRATALEGNHVLVEIPTLDSLVTDPAMAEAIAEQLVEWGFQRPTETKSTWWIDVADGNVDRLFEAAFATASALLSIFGVTVDEMIEALTDAEEKLEHLSKTAPQHDVPRDEREPFDSELANRIAQRIARQLVSLRGTGDSLTVDVGYTYYQAASYERDQVLIEIPSEQFLPDDHPLPAGAEEALIGLGFTRPSDSMPNWWIGIEDGNLGDLGRAAQATVLALVKLYGIPLATISQAVIAP